MLIYFVSITIFSLFSLPILSFKCPGDDDVPEAKMNAVELIRHNGYQAEAHSITTKDGYLLTIHRIINEKISAKIKPVVFLQHGAAVSSTQWFLNLPNQSLPFILVDHGYDVWLGNTRGNTYSKRHLSLFPNESSFWNFSWDDMAENDLPAMIDYVLNITGNEQLVYVGHSQGTLIGFAKMSSDPNFAKKLINFIFFILLNSILINLIIQIKLFIALAPVTTLGDIKGRFKYLVPFTWSVQTTFFVLGYYSLSDVHQITKYFYYNASAEQLALDVCRKISLYLSHLDATTVINKTRIPVFLGHMPDDTSMKNVVHFGQMVTSGQMQRYDYGFIQNYFIYGSVLPPKYNLDNFNVTTAVFWSPTDELSSGKDVENLLLTLKNVSHYKLENYRHVDFLLSLKATKDIYHVILRILNDTFVS